MVLISRYGIDSYGTAYYGATSLVEFSADPFLIVNRDYGSLSLSWTTPGGVWDRLRVVRNAYGAPINADDGTVVYERVTADADNEFVDTNLTGGVFYYYSIFVRTAVGVGFQWLRSANSSGLVVQNHGYSELLLDRLPSVFTTDPASTATRADTAGVGGPEPLINRFLSLFGFQFDSVRTNYETLRDGKDADRVGSVLLPLLAFELGQFYEPEIGDRQMRVLLRNTVYLYKKKGTTPAITGLASSLTGWGADVLPLTNLMLDEDDASAESSVGRWYVRSGNGALSRRPSDVLVNDEVIPPGAVVGYRNASYTNRSRGMFQMTGSGTGAVVLATVPTGQAVAKGIPFDPTRGAVSASVFVRHAATTRSPTLSLEFFDRRGTLLTAPSAVQTTGATAADWTRRNSVTVATPPAAARYVGVVLTYPATAAAEVQLFDSVQVEYASAPTGYRAARSVRLQLSPDRTNGVTNPSFEVDTSGWVAAGGATLSRSTTQAQSGSSSLRVVPTGSGSSGATYSLAVTAGTAYTFSASLKADAARTVRLTYAGGPASPQQAVATDWGRLSLTFTATATGPLLLSIDSGTDLATTAFNVDSVLAEEGTAVRTYFDGSTVGSFDQGWTGTAHSSTSVYYTQRAVRDSRLRANIERYMAAGTHYEIVYADGDTYSP